MIDQERIQTGFVSVNGANIYYETVGEGHPLLLVHGGLADSRMWDDQILTFARQYRVIRFDMRGFGKSETPAGSFAYHEDIRGLLEAMGVETTYLMGVSFGARTAIDFTLAHPEMVDALIPVAPALGGYSWSEETVESMEEADRLAEGGDVAAAVELELRLWIDGPERTPDQVDARVRERVREMNAHNWAIATDAGIPSELEVPAIERRGEIRAPTLVVVGDRDVRDIGRVADLLVAGIPGARRAVIAGAAHHPNMERPEEFNRIVLDFLAGLSDGQKEGSRP